MLRRCVPATVVLNTWEAFQPSGDALFAHVDRQALPYSLPHLFRMHATTHLHPPLPFFAHSSNKVRAARRHVILLLCSNPLHANPFRNSALVSCLADAEDAFAAGGPGALFILKPSLANKGAEVTVVATFEDVLTTVKAWPDVREWVLQAYVTWDERARAVCPVCPLQGGWHQARTVSSKPRVCAP